MVKKFLEYYSSEKSESIECIKDFLTDFEDLESVKCELMDVYCTKDLKCTSYSIKPGFFLAYKISIYRNSMEDFTIKDNMEFYQKLYQLELRIKNYFDIYRVTTPSGNGPNVFFVLDPDQNTDVDPKIEAESIFNSTLPMFVKEIGWVIRYGTLSIFRSHDGSFFYGYNYPVSLKKSLTNKKIISDYINSKFPGYNISIDVVFGVGQHKQNCIGFNIKFVDLI